MTFKKLIPREAYPLVLFIAGILSFASYRCYVLAKGPYVRFKKDKDESYIEKNKDQ